MKKRNDIKNYKLLTLFLVLNVVFQMLSNITAGKIISIFGFGVSVTVIYFPIVYIISDLMTEVYGYTRAKRVLQYTLLANVLVACFTQLMLIVPPAPFFHDNAAYETVFGVVPRVVVGGWLALYFGDISNNYVMAKVKLWTKGKYLPLRTISSTVVGQLVDTSFFYIVGLSGVIPMNALLSGILAGWLLKTTFEALFTPVTCFVIKLVKRIENEDYYDEETNFNPFN